MGTFKESLGGESARVMGKKDLIGMLGRSTTSTFIAAYIVDQYLETPALNHLYLGAVCKVHRGSIIQG